MENPEAIFDVLSIRSMKERYYASNSANPRVFAPTPSAAIASDLVSLANQEALEHFVQDFTIDDSISDCFADFDPAMSFEFSSKAPTQAERQLLTAPKLPGRVAQPKPDGGPQIVGEPRKLSPTRPKVTFALQSLDSETSEKTPLRPTTKPPPNVEHTKEVIYPSQLSSASESNDPKRPGGNSDFSHAQRSKNVKCKGEVLSQRSADSQGKVTPKQRQKSAECGKIPDKEKEKENSVSKFPKFGLSWVIGNTINRGKKHQAPNKRASREEDPNQKIPQTNDQVYSPVSQKDAPLPFTDSGPDAKDYTITSIGVAISTDEGFDDILVTPRNSLEKRQNCVKDFQIQHSSAASSHDSLDSTEDTYSAVNKSSILQDQENKSKNAKTNVSDFRKEIDRQPPHRLLGTLPNEKFHSPKHKHSSSDMTPTSIGSSIGGSIVSMDQFTRGVWYENSSCGNVESDSKQCPSSRAISDTRIPLCDVIQSSADLNSEKDSDSLLSGNSRTIHPQDTARECCIIGPKERPKTTENKQSSCPILVHQRDLENTGEIRGMSQSFPGIGSKTVKNSCACVDSATPSSSSQHVYDTDKFKSHSHAASRYSKYNEKGGIGGQPSSSWTLALELVCEELLGRCLVLESDRDRCYYRLAGVLPEACASLSVASHQLLELLTSAGDTRPLSADLARNFKQTAESISSTTASLKETASFFEMPVISEDDDDVENDSTNSTETSRIVGVLAQSASDMLERGHNLPQIKSNMRHLISGIRSLNRAKSYPARPGTNSSSTNKESGTRSASGVVVLSDFDEPAGQESELFHATENSAKLTKEALALSETRSVLSPEEQYPSQQTQNAGQALTKPDKCPGEQTLSEKIVSAASHPRQQHKDGSTVPPASSVLLLKAVNLTPKHHPDNKLMSNNSTQSQAMTTPKPDHNRAVSGAMGVEKIISCDTKPTLITTDSSNFSATTLTPTHHNTARNGRHCRGERRKRRRSHSLGRRQHFTGSSDIFNDSSSAVEDDDFETSASRGVSQNEGRGRHYRRRSQSAARQRSRSRRTSSCHSCHSDSSPKVRQPGQHSDSIANSGNYREADDNSRRKCNQTVGGPRCDGLTTKGDNAHSATSRYELSRPRRGRQMGRSYGSHDFDDYDDDEEEEDDDEEGDSLKVRVNVPNEDFSDNALRVQRLKQHLHSVQKLRQRNRDVIETVVTGTGERLAPPTASRDRSHDQRHVNIGEAYPFRSQEDHSDGPDRDKQAGGTGQTHKSKKAAGAGKLQGPFKGKRGARSHLFSHGQPEGPEVKVRELTESEFEETFERRNDVTVRRRREMDAGIPWDELEFSGLESDATLTAWSDGER